MEEKQNERVIYVECVEELNSELYDRFGETESSFGYSTNGFVHLIDFDGVTIWNSESEDREWIEDKNDYEPIMPFIKSLFNKWVDKLYSLKLVEVKEDERLNVDGVVTIDREKMVMINDHISAHWYRCPKCGNDIFSVKDKYCSKCGSKLKFTN